MRKNYIVTSVFLLLTFLIEAQSFNYFIPQEALVSKTPKQLRLARNEVFARRGYEFKGGELSEYFKKFSWYIPKSNTQIKLTDQEERYIKEIKRLEWIHSNYPDKNVTIISNGSDYQSLFEGVKMCGDDAFYFWKWSLKDRHDFSNNVVHNNVYFNDKKGDLHKKLLSKTHLVLNMKNGIVWTIKMYNTVNGNRLFLITDKKEGATIFKIRELNGSTIINDYQMISDILPKDIFYKFRKEVKSCGEIVTNDYEINLSYNFLEDGIEIHNDDLRGDKNCYQGDTIKLILEKETSVFKFDKVYWLDNVK